MLQYNQWANVAYGRWLVEQPEEKLHQELESSFKSIDLTIQHMTRTQ